MPIHLGQSSREVSTVYLLNCELFNKLPTDLNPTKVFHLVSADFIYCSLLTFLISLFSFFFPIYFSSNSDLINNFSFFPGGTSKNELWYHILLNSLTASSLLWVEIYTYQQVEDHFCPVIEPPEKYISWNIVSKTTKMKIHFLLNVWNVAN